jgi:glyoxylase I family protein
MVQVSEVVPLIQVFDMPTALRFYRDGLGFDVAMSSPEVETPERRFSHWIMLRSGQTRIMLNTAYDAGARPIEPDSDRVAAHADTILYFGCDDVEALHDMLVAKGSSSTRRIPRLMGCGSLISATLMATQSAFNTPPEVSCCKRTSRTAWRQEWVESRHSHMQHRIAETSGSQCTTTAC